MTTKVARLSTAEITFTPEVGAAIVLGHQQGITLSRSSDKKELLSQDVLVDETVEEIETNIAYTFKTDIGDLSLDILALIFKGSVKEKTYKAGDVFITGKTIVAKTAAAPTGTPVIDGDKIYIATQDITAGGFDTKKCSPKTYPTTLKQLTPEVRTANYGRLECRGVNLVTGKEQILIIPKINLSFAGDFTVSGNDFAKVSLEGKVLRVQDTPLYTFIDA